MVHGIRRFASAYLSEIFNEPDAGKRHAAVDRLIHPDVCHVSFDSSVYGRAGFERRIEELRSSLPHAARAELRHPPVVRANTMTFSWRLVEERGQVFAFGSAFVVFTGRLAAWIYTTVNADTGQRPS
ncbi:hypothetical protein SAMN04487847_2947 [Microbacterium sp. cf332]|nr:hypothetical protein SAMN04487847_2947 [Microbacterium sp. cf332]